MHQTDVVIAGAGVIGLSLALELRRRGRRVTVLERAQAGSGASHAAAGMLAAHDPTNPLDLQPLANLSEQLYPAFLDRLAQLAPTLRVPFQTAWTLEAAHHAGTSVLPQSLTPAVSLPNGVSSAAGPFHLMAEHSLDPRRLIAALVAACKKAPVRVLEAITLRTVEVAADGSLRIGTGDSSLICAQFVDCTGAWGSLGVRPVKGQMLRVQLGDVTPHLPGYGNVVLRTPTIYVVPRLDGSAVIGATLEEKGFCIKTKDGTIADLRARAAALLPVVATAPELERWAGLRPASTDCLPLLGPMPGKPPNTCYVANGHFRNGILLAPASAHVMAQMLCGEATSVSLQRFNPGRFSAV